MFDKYHAGYFGKKGMRVYHKNKQSRFLPILNLSQLPVCFEANNKLKNGILNKKRSEIHITGSFKLLGKGEMPFKSMNIIANSFSKKAVKKIIQSGGTFEIE